MNTKRNELMAMAKETRPVRPPIKDALGKKEIVEPLKMTEFPIKTLLKHAITTVHHTHEKDPDLVREGAKHHGVKVSEKTLLEAIEERAYNFRVPHGDRRNKLMKETRQEELEAIMNAKHIIVGCMDYRQSAQISKLHQEEKTIFFFTAGGAVQPTDDRFSEDVQFVAIAAQASGADVDLYYHTGVCGGANHFTDGEMRKIHDRDGLAGEINAMDPYAMGFAQELVEFGINQSRIKIHRVDINDQNEVMGIVDIPFVPRQPAPALQK